MSQRLIAYQNMPNLYTGGSLILDELVVGSATISNLEVENRDVTGTLTASNISCTKLTARDICVDNQGGEAYINFELDANENGGLRFFDGAVFDGASIDYESDGNRLLFQDISISGKSPVMVIETPNKNVGIGTDDAFNKLDVYGGDIIVRNSGNTFDSTSILIQGAQESIGSLPANIKMYNYNDTQANTTELVEINAIPTNAANTDGAFAVQTTDNSSLTEKFRITADGLVGIGTDNPVQELHIHDPTENTRIQITNNTTGATVNDGIILGLRNNDEAVLINRENTKLSFWTNNQERLSIIGGGNVGVGTDAPDELFHVRQSGSDLIGKFETTSTTSGGVNILTGTGGDSFLKLGDGTNSAALSHTSGILRVEVPENSEVFSFDSNSVDLNSGIQFNHNQGVFNNVQSSSITTFQGGGSAQVQFRTSSTTSANSEILIQGARNNNTTEDVAAIRFQNFDNDIGSTDTLAKISMRVVDTTDNNDGSLILQTTNNAIPTDAVVIDENQNCTITGWCRSVFPGQLLNMDCVNNPTLTNTTINSTSYQVILSYTYSRVSSSSKILATFDTSHLIASSGATSGDSYLSDIRFGGTTFQVKAQDFINQTGGGTRSGVLFPISAVYTNSATGNITIQIRARKLAAGDGDISIDTDCTIMIWEFAR